MLNKKALAGSASTPPAFVEDVFSTYLYTGTSSNQTINNGIDLASKGGMVWTKSRSSTSAPYNYNTVYDTVRGAGDYIRTESTAATSGYNYNALASFNSNGFGTGTTISNFSGVNYCSWTFRKQPKFFDVVTYTGTGSAQNISHSLGSVPGMMVVKCTSNAGYNWLVYHRSLNVGGNGSASSYAYLNDTAAAGAAAAFWNATDPTSSVFTVGATPAVNQSGFTYVAYLFAHDAGGFGLAGTDNVISCGSFTTDGSGNATVNLGYEPQWVIAKNTAAGYNWDITDSMRGFITWNGGASYSRLLKANSDSTEGNSTYGPTSTGFTINNSATSNTYIYMAIRRPMKVPTVGTSVYNAIARTGTGTGATVTGVGFATDLVFSKDRTVGIPPGYWDRLRGRLKYLTPSSTIAEASDDDGLTGFDSMDGILLGADSSVSQINNTGRTFINHFFKRASGFFDVVCYTGTGANRTVAHNLTAVPELMIVKYRNAAASWRVYSKSLNATDNLSLNTTNAVGTDTTLWNSTAPTSTVFSIGTSGAVNTSAGTYVAYLFATCAGVSKVGSYTGTGATQTINCGFTGGARFVLIKRTDSTGDWYVWDTARGIIAGNDPYLLLNSTAAEDTSTDYIDPVSSGFELSSTAPAAINASGGSYIFLSIS